MTDPRFSNPVYCKTLNSLNEIYFSQSQCHSAKHHTQARGKWCIMFSTQVGNKKTHKNKVINCPHTVTKCHQEPVLSLTWHLIICLQSDSWQAPPSEPSVWLCCVSSHQPQRQAVHTGEDESLPAAKVPSLCATTMLVLLMSSLPIKSATVNYCNYEGELPSNPSFDGVQGRCESCCLASVAPRVCSSGVLAANWLSSETREHMTVVTWGRLRGSSWITGQVSHGWWSWLHFKSLNTVQSACWG